MWSLTGHISNVQRKTANSKIDLVNTKSQMIEVIGMNIHTFMLISQKSLPSKNKNNFLLCKMSALNTIVLMMISNPSLRLSIKKMFGKE